MNIKTNSKTIIFVLILLGIFILIFNLIWATSYNNKLNDLNQDYAEIISSEKGNYLDAKYNLFNNFLCSGVIVDTTLIVNNYNGKSFNEHIKQERLVLFYQQETCDICERDLFDKIKSLEKNIREEFIILLPVSSYKLFTNYNKEYELNFKYIFAYKEKILKTNVESNRGTFFVINEDFKIDDIYRPHKPIDEDFIEYIEIMVKKHSL